MFTRDECLARLRAQVAAGRPIIGGGAGTGISAKCAELGGIDLIIIYNSGRFRMAGRGSLAGMMPYGDANAIVMDMARDMSLLTCPYVFTPEEAVAMTRAGADVLIPHMGLTTKGSIGAKSAVTLEESAKRVQELADAARAVNPDVLVLCHGGPISEPADVRYVLDHTKGIVGFFGASSVERLPTEVAITGCVREFKGLALGR
jgi:predicted TIM-barrel enzyme